MAARSVKIPALASAVGMSYQGVRKILAGGTKEITAANSEKIAGYLKIRREWLEQGNGSMDLPLPAEAPADARRVAVSTDENPDLIPVRVKRLKVKAGISGFAIDPDEDEAPPIYFRWEWLQRRGFKPYNLIASTVGGRSMENTLYDGDLVVTHIAETEPIDGEVFSINYEGEVVIKRLLRDGGRWWLTSDNSDKTRYPHKLWTDADAIIIGRIVHRQSERI